MKFALKLSVNAPNTNNLTATNQEAGNLTGITVFYVYVWDTSERQNLNKNEHIPKKK
jgi:hypothetical protein